MHHLLAIDGPSIVRRVYEANPDPESDDKAQLALRHALSSFRKLLNYHQPSHVLVAFEGEGASWRQIVHPGYQRSPLPTPLLSHLPGFYTQLQALGLCVLALPDTQVTDVLATAVTRWLQESRGAATLASNHRLLHALIAQGATLWDHFRQEWHDEAWVVAKYGVPPQLLPELLALVGDAHEGVPGVSRIGMKTAARLLTRYGNLDAVLAGAGILPDTTGRQLRQERAALDLSRQLMQLKTDLVLGVTWKRLAWSSC